MTIFYGVVAFCAALIFLVILQRAAHRFGLVDRPSSRKSHVGEIPVVGGLAVGAAFLITGLVCNPTLPWFPPLIIACLVILATGLFDDFKEFSARSKFTGQLVAAVLMTSWANLTFHNLGDFW